ncbi:sushi repeat-containing protein SRPX-like [Apostichopus japonicus]|uniref:sushi repeat-containing protein SRPX-like n=1 Tax=Stichopus japonicus TaxID=307972 RepID=UPI003AB30805
MKGFLLISVVIAFAFSTECSANSLFLNCPAPWTIEATSRLKRVWWRTPLIHHQMVYSMRRIGSPPGSVFTAGKYSVRYEAQGFDGSNSTCRVTFTVKVTECPPIPQIGQSVLRCTNGNIWPSRCDFYCPEGYQMSGGYSSTTTCTRTGDWSPGTFPICRLIKCPKLPRPRNTQMTCRSSTIRQGTWCQFTCIPGYNMHGSPMRTCVKSEWTGVQPTCEDELPPNFLGCPAKSVRVDVQQGMGSKRVFYPMPIAFDRYQPVEVSLVSGQVSGSWFHLGNNLVHLVAVDGAGNVAHCRFNIQVIDNQPPRFQYCPKPIFAYSDPKVTFVVVNYTTPVAMDNSSPNPINVTRVLGRESGSTFSPGVYTIQYTANDDTGNYAECVFYIVVKVSSCKPLTSSKSVYRTCSRNPPFIRGTWCDLSCVEGRFVGSPIRSCGKDGWSGQPSACIETIPGSNNETTMPSIPPLKIGTEDPIQ